MIPVGLAVNPSPPDEPEFLGWSEESDAVIAEAGRRLEVWYAARAAAVLELAS